MPFYDYRCREHGLFERLASVAECAEAGPCPRCGVLAVRVITAPPALLDMAPERREAFARNERSRHEPRLHAVGEEDSDHRCGDDPGSVVERRAILLADGSKVFPSQRPWMIGH